MHTGLSASAADLASISFGNHDGCRTRALARPVTRIGGTLAGVFGGVANIRHLGAFAGVLDIDEQGFAIGRLAQTRDFAVHRANQEALEGAGRLGFANIGIHTLFTAICALVA